MKQLKLNEILYQVDKDREMIHKCVVVWIYNLERVDCEKDFFFNSPKQLISVLNYPNKCFSDEFYNNKVNKFLETWRYEYPIERHSFIDIDDVHSNIYRTKKESEDSLQSYIKTQNREREKDKKIAELEMEIVNLLNK